MPSEIALVLGICLIAWLIQKDRNWRSAGSSILLVPAVFIALQGSRPLSFWLGSAGGSNLDGNPVNTAFFALLGFGSLVVLRKRGVNWIKCWQYNKALVLIYLYFAVSALWSDVPLVSAKRLVKDFTCVLLAMVVLSEANPVNAFKAIFVRVACVLFPLSLILGNYFPDLGRSYSFAGEPMFTGVAPQKNLLGEIVFVFGLVIFWDLLGLCKARQWRGQKVAILMRVGLLLLGFRLLVLCNSKTSLVCLVTGISVLWLSRWFTRMRNGKGMLIFCLAAAIAFAAADRSLGISHSLIKALGRDPTLTGRTDIWGVVLKQQTNHLFGGGFCMFWDTAKGEAVGGELAFLRSAHNGYLETYLDGGIIGAILLGLFLLAVGGRVINRLFGGGAFGDIGLAFWLAAIIFNISESSFFRLDPLWFTLLLISIQIPRCQALAAKERARLPKSAAIAARCAEV